MENIRTKIALITGLLGAGKTTFIMQYCEYLKSIGKTFIIIENEFGAAGIDVAILKEKGYPVTELSGGCICCTLKVDFVYTLINFASVYDYIIVEPSGIFTTKDFFDVALSPAVRNDLEIGFIATIIDPNLLDFMGEDEKQVFLSQCESTGCVVLSKNNPSNSNDDINKIKDLMDELLVDKKWHLNDSSEAFITMNRENFTDETFSKISNSYPVILENIKPLVDHALIYQSTTINPSNEFAFNELEKMIEQLFTNDYGFVMRVKGYLKGKNSEIYLINCTNNNFIITKSNEKVFPMLNIIGKKMNRKLIKQLFKL